MAKLCRLSKLNDRFNTHVFTFQIPATVLLENEGEFGCKEFIYGHQLWSLSISVTQGNVAVYLKLCQATNGLICNVDYTFRLTNNQHFSKSITFTRKNCTFTVDKDRQGTKSLVSREDLLSRGFTALNDNMGLELQMQTRALIMWWSTTPLLPI